MIIILQQFLGVLLQTIPVAVLLGIFFDEEDMRGRKQNYYIGAVAILLVGGLFFSVITTQKSQPDSRIFIGNMLMTFVVLLFCFFYFYYVKAGLMKKVIALGMGCNYAAIVYLLNGVLMELRPGYGEPQKYPYFPENLFGLVLTTLVSFPLVLLFVNRIVKKSIQKLECFGLKRQCFFVVTGLLLFCIECTVLGLDDLTSVLWISAAILGNVVVMYYLFFYEINLMKEQFELVGQLNNFRLQSRSIGKNIDEMKRMNHNVRHHLNVIKVLNEERKYEEITEYLKSLEKEYVRVENEKLSGYMILDSVLRYYFQQMRNAQIKIETNFQIGSSYEFEPIDITILFGNCLENVMEELEQIPEEERLVELNIRARGEMFTIALKNRCRKGKSVNGGEFTDWKHFLSSKRSSETGEGLASIHYIAEKYGGNARFKRDDEWFVMHVFLRIP